MLLVDGHNVIGRARGLSLSDEERSREELLRRIAAAKGSGGERVVVFFDGDRPQGSRESFGGLAVVYAPANRTADYTDVFSVTVQDDGAGIPLGRRFQAARDIVPHGRGHDAVCGQDENAVACVVLCSSRLSAEKKVQHEDDAQK